MPTWNTIEKSTWTVLVAPVAPVVQAEEVYVPAIIPRETPVNESAIALEETLMDLQICLYNPELTFGEREPAVGWLVGDVHDGIAQMFKVIEYARMLVGTKAIATLSAGYLAALEYTKTRVQGPDLTQASDKTAPRVTVIHHPDVRRSLMTQKALYLNSSGMSRR